MFEIQSKFGKQAVKISGGHAQIGEIEEILKKIKEIDDSCETVSQIFDATRIAGKEHLLHSSKLALEALESGKSFADSPRIELTCWVAGSRQINKSLERVGVKEESNKIAVVTRGEKKSQVEDAQNEILQELEIEKDEELLEISEEKKSNLQKAFSLSQNQVDVSSTKDMILEKVALLSLEQ